jgi:hypothetical protein
MTHNTHATSEHRRAWPSAARALLAMIAVAFLALLAACGSSAAGSGGSANGSGSAGSPSAVAYSHCMRSHGVPNYPDPSGNGQVPKTSAQLLGVSNSQFQAGQTACQHLYPTNGSSGGVLTKSSIQQCEETGECPQALVQAAMSALRTYAKCVRSHGLPTWPDPTLDSEGRPGFNLLHVTGFDPNSSQTSNIMQECYHVMPGGVPVPVIAPGVAG